MCTGDECARVYRDISLIDMREIHRGNASSRGERSADANVNDNVNVNDRVRERERERERAILPALRMLQGC